MLLHFMQFKVRKRTKKKYIIFILFFAYSGGDYQCLCISVVCFQCKVLFSRLRYYKYSFFIKFFLFIFFPCVTLSVRKFVFYSSRIFLSYDQLIMISFWYKIQLINHSNTMDIGFSVQRNL